MMPATSATVLTFSLMVAISISVAAWAVLPAVTPRAPAKSVAAAAMRM